MLKIDAIAVNEWDACERRALWGQLAGERRAWSKQSSGSSHGKRLAMLLAEQNVVQSLALADRAYVIENGYIALTDPAAELVEKPELKRSYLGL